MNKVFFVNLLIVSWCIACNMPADNKTSEMSINIQFDSSLNNADKQLDKQPEKWILSSAKETDFFIEPGDTYRKANAPLLLKRINNSQPFTFTVKLTPEHRVKYDAGMAFIFIDTMHWLKFAFEADERMHTRIVTVRTEGVSDDNNHEIVNEKTIFLKISSDTKSIGFYYSLDHLSWNLVRIFKNEYPSTIYVGVGSQSPAGNGNKTIFTGIELTDSAVKDFRMGL